MKYCISFLVLFCYISCSSSQVNKAYCSRSLCNTSKHIACGNNGAYSTYCSKDRLLLDILHLRKFIVGTHNQVRNLVASGKLPRYRPAVRMATMTWDSELSYLAGLNVKRCLFEHDDCRNTVKFRRSGQNLAWKWAFPIPNTQETIAWAMNQWFLEYKDANMGHINKFNDPRTMMSHFGLMVAEKNNKIGCAILRQTDGEGMELFFACNYATTNTRNFPVYTSGPTASNCTRGTNPAFPALCAVAEPFDNISNIIYK